ncbi:MAG: hypothetical protein ABSH46_06075 [Bryobacteraceae bacterium]|jgi:hypothetical protein
MQFPILQYLDVVIGLAVVMIVIATFVTAVTQFIMSATYARARYLRDGLQTLIAQLDPKELGDHARYLAELALRDETVGSKKLLPWLTAARNWLRRHLPWLSANNLPAFSPASVIQREELVLLLLRLASQAPPASTPDAKGTALRKLLDAVKGKGSFDAAEELKKIQAEILNQEAADPRAAASTWRSKAIQEVTKGTTELHDFVARLNAWYDNTMDRVSSNFGLEAKVVTAVVAFIACAWLQLDTVGLVKRLSTDANYRNAVVSQAKDLGVVAQDPQTKPAQPTPTPDPGKPAPCGGLTPDQCREQVVNKLAEVRDLSLVPAKPGMGFGTVEWSVFGFRIKLPIVKPVSPETWPWSGLLLSWVLVSLGAPFWYDVLKNVMGLRSSLAQLDDKDREGRQAQQTGPAA